MLRLRKCVVSYIISPSATSAIFPLRRRLSASAVPISPNPTSRGFAIEEYLVDICGLTRPQALKASTKLSHLKSLANPNAVLAFLAGLGLSGADAAVVVAKDPLFLCAGVERTLAPVVNGITGLGLSRSDIARLVSLAPDRFCRRAIVSRLHYYLPLLGSLDNFLRMLKREPGLMEYLKNTFRWSDAEANIAVRKFPSVLRNSKDFLKHRSEFLFSEVGLEPVYIAHQPAILSYSLEGRLRPRYYVIKFLRQNGLLDRDSSFCTVVKMTEKVFVEKLITPYKEAAPHLAEDYATACNGEVPTNFRFT